MKKRIGNVFILILFLVFLILNVVKNPNVKNIKSNSASNITDTATSLVSEKDMDVYEIWENDEFETLSEDTIEDEDLVYEGPDPFESVEEREYEEKEILTEEGVLTFRVYDDESKLITYEGEDETVIIPAMVGDKPVTEIGNAAFFGLSGIKHIDIPNTIKIIGNSAFYSVSFEEINIPESIEEIKADAFQNVSQYNADVDESDKNLTVRIGKNLRIIETDAFKSRDIIAFDVDSQNPYFCSVEGVLYSKDMKELIAFPMAKLGDIIIPEGVEKVSDTAFCDRKNITRQDGMIEIVNELYLPNSLTTFSSKAISNSNIGTVYIGDNLKDWNDLSAAVGVNYIISKKNPYYVLENGFIFDQDKKHLLYCVELMSEDLIIPDCVEYIDSHAFESINEAINSIHIGEKLISVGDDHEMLSDVFSTMKNLKHIDVDIKNENFKAINGVLFDHSETELIAYPRSKGENAYSIPDGVKTIASKAFYNNNDLTDIFIPDSYEDLIDNYRDSFLIGFNNLYNINVSENNEIYYGEGPFLIRKKEGTLLFVSGNYTSDTLIIPDGVKAIAPGVFDKYSIGLPSEIHFPDSLVGVFKDNFTNIEKNDQWDVIIVYIPNGQTKISTNAFKDSEGILVNTVQDSYVSKVMEKHEITVQYLQ